ncbi:MAG: response regulator [Planctomycetes bacterium]|nr:response regulator [Planctomycetota bacterium]
MHSKDMPLADRLRHLGRSGGTEFAQRIRQRVAPHEATECESSLRGLVRMMPSLLGRLRRLWTQTAVSSDVKKLNGHILGYLHHPQDLIAEDEHGLFGYVDDAYLIATVYLRAAEGLSHDHPLKRGEERHLMLQTQRLLLKARRVIPTEAEKIDRMLERALMGDDSAFQQALMWADGEAYKRVKGKTTVLLVENDPHQRILFEEELTEEGYAVRLAQDGREALRMVREERPDVVVLDLHMPFMDGLDALPRLLSVAPALPVIIYSGYSRYRDNFMAWLADDYVVKSSDLTPLKEAIAQVLAKRAIQPADAIATPSE